MYMRMKKKRRSKKYQSKQKKKRIIIASIIAFVVIAVIVVFVILSKPPLSYNKYKAFGIYMPVEYAIHGIDISRYQGSINWQMVKEVHIDSIKIGFAFMKATEGIESSDPNFKENWVKSKHAGIPRGAYHFFLADRDGTLQAKNFITNVQLEPGDLPPVVDVEKLSGVPKAQLIKELKEYIAVIEGHYGVKPIIYTYAFFYKENLQNELSDYPLWIAHYELEDRRPQLDRDWQFWQHSEKGNVSGINVKVDMNVFYGDSLLFKEMLIN